VHQNAGEIWLDTQNAGGMKASLSPANPGPSREKQLLKRPREGNGQLVAQGFRNKESAKSSLSPNQNRQKQLNNICDKPRLSPNASS